MPVNVVMPQMGESVAEGTVVRWIRRSATTSIATSRCSRSRPTRSTPRSRRRRPGTLAAIHVQGRRDGAGRRAGRGDRAGRRSGRGGPAGRRPRQPDAGRRRVAPRRRASAPRRPATAGGAAAAAARRGAELSADDGAAAALVAAGPPHRQRAPGRHRLDPRLRHRRPRHQARHPASDRGRRHGVGPPTRLRSRRTHAPQRAVGAPRQAGRSAALGRRRSPTASASRSRRSA